MKRAAKDFIRMLLREMDPSLAAMSEDELSAFLARMRALAPGTKHPSPRAAKPAALPPNGVAPPRWQDGIIEKIVPEGSTVLDLGCGEGQLLARLIRDKHVRGQGVELDPGGVFVCVERKVPVFQSDLDAGLKGFADGSFDYVILEETLQTLHHPDDVLSEMLRVGRTGIVSFPNFAYWRVRLDLALGGRMPVTETLPYHWYDTPNIHLLTLFDFMDWARTRHVAITQGHALIEGRVRPLDPEKDTLYAEEVLLVVEADVAQPSRL